MAGHDVLVVGAGLGGLAGAVALAGAGCRVGVFEAHEVAGGYATNFERGAFRFDASLHLLDAVAPGGANRPIWERLGLHERVTVETPEILRREIWPEHDLAIGQGMDAWVDALAEAFPREREGLMRLAALAVEVHEAVLADRDARLAGALPPPLGAPLSDLLDVTAGPVIRGFVSDPRLVAIAGSLSCYLGLGCDELAAIPYFTMLASYHNHGGSYPVGGSGAIAQALVDRLGELGADLRLEAPVAAIRCARRTVRGITLADGEEIDAPVVLSNVSPLDTYARLVTAGEVDRRFLRKLDRMTLGTSVVKVWLGFERDPCPDGIAYETFLRTGYGTTFGDATADDLGVVAPHVLDPGCAPADGGVVSITAGAEATLDPARLARCGELAELAVRRVEERLLPGLRHATVRVVATPRTFHRYTDNPGGTIHGFRPVPAQSGPRRLGVAGPVAGLYHAGGWTYAGSGFLPAMTSGLVVAAAIQGRLP